VFGDFDHFGPPRYFWCLFVGIPLIAIGGILTKLGYLGAISRYLSGEVSPVARDTFNNMAHGTRGGVETLANAIGRGFVAANRDDFSDESRFSSTDVIHCPDCDAFNPPEARFCNQCGQTLDPPAPEAMSPCPQCGADLTAGARFCNQCGQPVIAS
jgi:ribosomal protein L40E